MDLVQGQNTILNSRFFELEMLAKDAEEINFFAILLHGGKSIPSTNEIIQKNWCCYPDIFEFESSTVFTIDLDNVDQKNVEKILICADFSIKEDRRASQNGPICLKVHDREKISFNIETKDRNDRAVIIAEIYCHKGDWKVRAMGSGFVEGMSALLKSYGVEDFFDGYVSRSLPAIETKSHSKADIQNELQKFHLSGFNREEELRMKINDTKRFQWGEDQDLNVLEICGLLSSTKVEDPYFSVSMRIHIGAFVELNDGNIVKLDHTSTTSPELDDYIWLYPEEKPEITTHSLIITKESSQVVKHVHAFAYIDSDIPYWKRAKPKIFIKPNKNQTLDLTPEHYDMSSFALSIAHIRIAGNGVEIEMAGAYKDSVDDLIN